MTSERRIDAVIVGAGPAGSSAAILLAQAGWSVVLIEKHEFPRRKVCGECIAASNLDLLDALGIGEEFARLAGTDLRIVKLLSGVHSVEAELPANSHGTHQWGRALGREHLDTLLLARAKSLGVTVLQPFSARDLTGLPGAWSCVAVAADTHEEIALETPVMIGAFGSWEVVPTSTRRQRDARKPGDLFAFKANFLRSRLEPGVLPVLALPGGYGGMVRGDHDITTIACCIRRDALAKCRHDLRGGTAADAVETWLKAHCRGVATALEGAERPEPWLAVGPIRPGVRVGNDPAGVFLIGNAAGEAHPIIGEGISMAVQSAWLLCERLVAAGGGAAPVAADLERVAVDYARAWRRAFSPRIRWSAIVAQLAMRPRFAEKLLLPLLAHWPGLIKGAARVSGKIHCAVDLRRGVASEP